jgi:iron complex transport system permease protein
MVSEDEASSLGVRVGLVRNTLLATASLITGTAVAFSGAIVFVGLVVPHTLRPISGADKSLLVSLAPWAAECSYWLRQAGPQQAGRPATRRRPTSCDGCSAAGGQEPGTQKS